MPEGDTLFKIAGFIRQRAEGRRVVGAALLGRPAPSLAHRRVLAVDVHGKHLCVDLGPPGAGGFRLRVHPGMFGSWHHYPAEAPWQHPRRQASVVLEVEGAGTFVCFLAADVGLACGRSGSKPRGRPEVGSLRQTVGETEVARSGRLESGPACPWKCLDMWRRSSLWRCRLFLRDGHSQWHRLHDTPCPPARAEQAQTVSASTTSSPCTHSSRLEANWGGRGEPWRSFNVAAA